jgi:hypothetical protein
VELTIFNPGPPTVITAASGFGGRGRTSQMMASIEIADDTTNETTTATTRRERVRPADDLIFEPCDLDPCDSIRFTRATISQRIGQRIGL